MHNGFSTGFLITKKQVNYHMKFFHRPAKRHWDHLVMSNCPKYFQNYKYSVFKNKNKRLSATFYASISSNITSWWVMAETMWAT